DVPEFKEMLSRSTRLDFHGTKFASHNVHSVSRFCHFGPGNYDIGYPKWCSDSLSSVIASDRDVAVDFRSSCSRASVSGPFWSMAGNKFQSPICCARPVANVAKRG